MLQTIFGKVEKGTRVQLIGDPGGGDGKELQDRIQDKMNMYVTRQYTDYREMLRC